jgi:hypothetical protein
VDIGIANAHKEQAKRWFCITIFSIISKMSLSYRQQLNEQESRLFNQLSHIYTDIQRKMNLELPSGNKVSWQLVKPIYQEKIDDSIRAGVTQIYQISARKIAEQDLEIPFFLTQTDLQEIRRLSQKYQDWFWIGLEREITTTTTPAALKSFIMFRQTKGKGAFHLSKRFNDIGRAFAECGRANVDMFRGDWYLATFEEVVKYEQAIDMVCFHCRRELFNANG